MENDFDERNLWDAAQQDFGSNFHFEPDGEALNSILENRGITRTKAMLPAQRQCTPLQATPRVMDNHKSEEQLEFFQAAAGKVYFRHKRTTPRNDKNWQTVRSPSPAPGRNIFKPRINMAASTNLQPVRHRPASEKKAATSLIPPAHRQSISERKALPSGLPLPRHVTAAQSANQHHPTVKKSLQFGPLSGPPRRSMTTGPVRRSMLGGGGGFSSETESFKKPLLPLAAEKGGMETPAGVGGLQLPLPAGVGGLQLPLPAGVGGLQLPLSAGVGGLQLPLSAGVGGLQLPLPPLMQLTRESMRFIPRESLAWISHLPRDSATFEELERLMGAEDRDLVHEDDTGSFEAMEKRLKTPMRAVPKSKVELLTGIKPGSQANSTKTLGSNISHGVNPIDANILHVANKNIDMPVTNTTSLESSATKQPADEDREQSSCRRIVQARSDLLTPGSVGTSQLKGGGSHLTPPAAGDHQSTEIMSPCSTQPRRDCEAGQDFNTTGLHTTPIVPGRTKAVIDSVGLDLAAELENLPGDPILGTPTIKSSSISDLTAASNIWDKDSASSRIELARCRSEEIISDGQSIELSSLVCSDRLHKIIADLDEYRAEQDELERQRADLLAKIQQRRQEFRRVWGASPLSINKTIRRNPVLMDLTNTGNKSSSMAHSTQADSHSSAPDTPSTSLDSQTQKSAVPSKPIRKSLSPPSIAAYMSTISVTAAEGGGGEDAENIPPGGEDAENIPPEGRGRRVRFNSGENDEKLLTPDIVQDFPCGQRPSANPAFSNPAFAALKSSFSFLQTPVAPPSHPKKRFAQRFEESSEDDNTEEMFPTGSQRSAVIGTDCNPMAGNGMPGGLLVPGPTVLPTPMALKSLSERVRAEFALLYADDEVSNGADFTNMEEEEDDNTLAVTEDIIKKLMF